MTKVALKNIVTAIFMMAGFTIFWTNFMIMALAPNIFAIIGTVLFLVIVAWLIYMGIKLKKFVSALPNETKSVADIRAEKWWNIIFITQGCAIGVCCALLGIFNLYGFMIPAIVLIVGLHYFPLGFLYRTPIHAVVGCTVVLSVVLTTIFLPTDDFDSTASGISALIATVSTSVLGIYMVFLIKNTRPKKR
jgi:hypothetical protein